MVNPATALFVCCITLRVCGSDHILAPSSQAVLCANGFCRTQEPVDEWRFTSLAYVNEKRSKARIRKLKNTTQMAGKMQTTHEAMDGHTLSHAAGAEI